MPFERAACTFSMMAWNFGSRRIGILNSSLLINFMPVVTFSWRALQGHAFHRIELVGAAMVGAAMGGAAVVGAAGGLGSLALAKAAGGAGGAGGLAASGGAGAGAGKSSGGSASST